MPPQRVVGRHPQDKPPDARRGRRTSLPASATVVPVAGNPVPVPSQDGGRRDRNTGPDRDLGRRRDRAANHSRSAGSYRIRETPRRSTAFSCRKTSSSTSFDTSRRTSSTGTARNLPDDHIQEQEDHHAILPGGPELATEKASPPAEPSIRAPQVCGSGACELPCCRSCTAIFWHPSGEVGGRSHHPQSPTYIARCVGR
jgi:hypothetical protein